MEIAIKILLSLTCSALFWWGGHSFKVARRFIMPFILALGCYLYTGTIWCISQFTAMASFSLGYGVDSVFKHIFGNGWGRSVWGLLGALALSLGLFVAGHLSLIHFLAYLAVNFVLENALKDINQKIGDPIIGLGFSSIIFIVH